MPHLTVRDLLSDETKWCKGTLALNCREDDTGPQDPFAVQWSLLGAMRKCYSVPEMNDAIYEVAHILKIHTGPDCANEIMNWNDAPGRTFGDIRRVIEEAGI